jgi:ABC-type branched-subunit amino acid transport system substrate-binding protein
MSTSEVDAVRYLRSAVIGLLACSACTAFEHELPECTTNAQCTAKLSTVESTVQGVCVHQPSAKCVQLTSVDCTTVTPALRQGASLDDGAVLIASLGATTGAQAATNLARQQSAMMAVEEINASNASGGILQSTTPGDARKLVMLSCDANANLARAATHLISELHVPAIVGPNLSQDTLDLTLGNRGLPSSAQAGTALLSPSAVASAIATIPDNGLSFMMVPSDIQRVPLMEKRIGDLEAQLKVARAKQTIKVAIYSRGDALGQGTRDGLATLTVNGVSLASAINAGNAREDQYDPLSTDNSALITQYLAFKPDIIVVIGTAEAVTYFTKPLEAAWPTGASAPPKPYYVAIDSTKVPELLTQVSGAAGADERKRWSGTGITPTPESQQAFTSFQVAYGQRWKDPVTGVVAPATVSGMGPAYDAVYTIALSLVGKHDAVIQGSMIAGGMPSLATNPQACASDLSGLLQAPCFSISEHSRTLYQNMAMLLGAQQVSEVGTFGRLEWDAQGAKSSGVIELWCIDGSGPKPVYASSGQTYDVKSQQVGAIPYTQCP